MAWFVQCDTPQHFFSKFTIRFSIKSIRSSNFFCCFSSADSGSHYPLLNF
jgi:hypothetical protein